MVSGIPPPPGWVAAAESSFLFKLSAKDRLIRAHQLAFPSPDHRLPPALFNVPNKKKMVNKKVNKGGSKKSVPGVKSSNFSVY